MLLSLVRRAVVIAAVGAIVGGTPARAAEPVVVVEPPADESPSGDSAVLRPSEDSSPVGFIAGYVGLTAVGVALVFVGRRDATGQSAIPRGTDVAYGPRSATDFWAEPSGGRRQTESEDRNRPRGALR